MSFYGQVIYEFKKLFNIFKFTNSVNNTSVDNISPLDGIITPSSERDLMEWKTGNHWITLHCDEDDKVITLYHDSPATNNTKQISGFIAPLPVDNITEEVIELQAGEYFSTSELSYDAAGHIVETNVKQYKLPMSETEKDISDIKSDLEKTDARLTKLEEFNSNITGTFVSQEDFNKFQSDDFDVLKNNTSNYINTIAPSIYATIGETGSPSDIYITVDKNEMPSLSTTIGKVDGNDGYSTYIATLNGNADKDAIYDISTSIISLVDYVQNLRDRIGILEALVAPK